MVDRGIDGANAKVSGRHKKNTRATNRAALGIKLLPGDHAPTSGA
jgi:hypothetical protein